jgi:hypothetical protein
MIFKITLFFKVSKDMVMKHNPDPIQTLGEIRSLMERSARFISLSGLSGVSAGIAALIGAALVFVYTGKVPFDGRVIAHGYLLENEKWGMSYPLFFVLVAAAVFVLAVGGGIFFTTRNARRKGQKVWDSLTTRMLINLAIPLVTGGIFCLALLQYQVVGFVAPTTLVFYGMALLHASKYTLPDIRYLGLCEIALGLIGLFSIGYGLELWVIGFGVLHIAYGIWMYGRYERAA